MTEQEYAINQVLEPLLAAIREQLNILQMRVAGLEQHSVNSRPYPASLERPPSTVYSHSGVGI